MTKFSIILIIDNDDNLEKCLNSIKEQTYKNYELICVCNNDKFINKKIDKFDNKQIIICENYIDGINKAIEKSNGDYISFVNSLDYLEMNYLSIIEKCTKVDVDIVRFQIRDFIDISNEKVISEISFKKCSGVDALEKIIKYKYVTELFCYSFKKDYLSKYKFDIQKINYDYSIMLNIIYNSKSCISIGDILYNHKISKKKNEYNLIRQLATDNIESSFIYLKNYKNNRNIENYLALNIIKNCSLLKKEEFKNTVEKIKNEKITELILNNKIKMLANINIKLCVALIK